MAQPNDVKQILEIGPGSLDGGMLRKKDLKLKEKKKRPGRLDGCIRVQFAIIQIFKMYLSHYYIYRKGKQRGIRSYWRCTIVSSI